MATTTTTVAPAVNDLESGPARKRYAMAFLKMAKKFEFYTLGPDEANAGSAKEGKQPSYVICSNIFTRSKPHFTLHVGSDGKDTPSVACVFEPLFTRTWKLGLGDVVNTPDAVAWEEMTKDGWSASKFSWSMAREDGTRLNVAWKRTMHHAIDGSVASKYSNRNYKLVETDGDGSEILAVFTSALSMRIYGSVQVNVDYGDNFEYLVLTTIASIYEAINR